MANLLVVGSANMDVVTPIDRAPAPGETLPAGDIRYLPGGKGANAAVAAARAGGVVRFAGCVGDDPFGSELRENLAASGADVAGLRTVDRQSGVAIILLHNATGENSILVSPGANALVEAPADPDWYAWGDALLLQLEIPIDAAIEAARRARQAGVTVILDPAPATPAPPAELLSLVDFLLPNETELATLTGKRVDTPSDVAEAAKALQREHGIAHVVVTLGGQGAMHVTNGTATLYPAVPIEPVDTTAAGDAFAGTFAVAIANGEAIEHALRFATAAGALACTTVGAQASIPTAERVRAFLDAASSTPSEPRTL